MTDFNRDFDGACHYQFEQETQQQYLADLDTYHKATAPIIDKLFGSDPGYDEFDAEVALQRIKKSQGNDKLEQFLQKQLFKLQGGK